MRVVVAAALLLTGALSTAQAQTRVRGVDVLGAGLFKFGEMKRIANPDISTGQRWESEQRLVKHTTTIPAEVDTCFGVKVMIRGTPRGKVVPFRIVWRYPAPGLTNPQTGKTKMIDDFIDQKTLGYETSFAWSLGSAWTTVPGRWTWEIWHEGQMLATQSFLLTKDAPDRIACGGKVKKGS